MEVIPRMKLSQAKKEKISEQILFHLYNIYPKAQFTAEIAREIARDEEFIKDLLFNLKDKGLVIPIRKNPQGIPYSRRIRWRISNQAYEAYKKQQ